MKKLLMSVAFIALVGSIVPADAGSTFAIGGGLNPVTSDRRGRPRRARRRWVARQRDPPTSVLVSPRRPTRRHLDRVGRPWVRARRERRGLVRQWRGHHQRRLQQHRYRCRRASPTCCHNVCDSGMVANRCHHAADRLWSAMLIWWRCEGKKLLLPAAQRLFDTARDDQA